MENDSGAIAIGLGAGLGGFVAVIIIGCILWNVFCGSWCDKKKVQTKAVQIPLQNQRIHRTEPPYTTQTNVTPFTSD
ncbi:hypothetical protein I4U23_000741 [Adineta vaga]|nr:hypothetical protein I4U23_000741 [Adineta vaga]